jgi:primosomal protein N' (replication factor Y)
MAPDHYAITSAINCDCKGFCEQELRFRAELDYPPFSFLAIIELSGNSETAVEKSAQITAAELSRQKRALHTRVSILGPATAPLAILRGRHRRQILLKAKHRNDLHQLLKSTREALELPSTVRLTIDIDPLDML